MHKLRLSFFAAALVGLNLTGVWAAPHRACTEPVAAVCSSRALPIVDPDETKKILALKALDQIVPTVAEAKAIREKLSLLPTSKVLETLDGPFLPLPGMTAYWIALEDAVFAALGDRFTRDKLKIITEQTRKTLIESATRSQSKHPKTQFENAISRAHWVGLSDYIKLFGHFGSSEEDAAGEFITPCGFSGFGSNMINTNLGGEFERKDPKTGAITVVDAAGPALIYACPGRLAEMIWDPTAEKRLQRTVIHEFAHQIDSFSHFKGYDMLKRENSIEDFRPIYAPLRACLKEKHASSLPFPERGSFDGIFGPDPVAQLKLQLGREPEAVDFYLSEISADLWAAKLIPSQVKTPDELLSTLTSFCGVPISHSHPSGEFRIKQSLADPAARKLLGCSSPDPYACL